jgi:hypothetical protein
MVMGDYHVQSGGRTFISSPVMAGGYSLGKRPFREDGSMSQYSPEVQKKGAVTNPGDKISGGHGLNPAFRSG